MSETKKRRLQDPEMMRMMNMPQENAQPAMPEMRATQTGDEEAAYNLGARMGAEGLAQLSGMGGGTTAAAGQPVQTAGTRMTEDRIIEAEKLLMRYKAGKTSIDKRIINAQDWWKLRNWQMIENERGIKGSTVIKSNTAWLWSCIVGKHSEAMDSYPEPIVLPRMEEDKPEAKMLSDILPVILSMNGFEEEYSKAQWQKYQEGTAAYHIGWDKNKLGGIGDISVKNINLLNLFWEPGIEDIQESQNVFYIQVVDSKQLEQQYPQLKGKLENAYLKPAEYRKDDSITMEGKSVLVDWYYHTWEGPRKILHYCQFVNHNVLYSTEEEGEANGLYQDGEYPFVLDPLYPVHNSPAGLGLIDICRDAQTDIDTLNQAMIQNSIVTSTPRFFIQTDGQVNEDEFADWSKPFVHTGGGLGENSIRQVMTNGIQSSAIQMLERKIDELKFVSGNTDVNNGGAPSGVTAASAIAALQEQSGKGSKDANRSSYRAANKIYTMVIERIRQFYEIPRWFRILGPRGQEQFMMYSNARLQDQQIAGGLGMADALRKPVFDIDVRSERETAYTKLSQNELAIQFLQLGAFNPQMTDQIMLMLDMMDFRGKEEIQQKIQQQGTLMDCLMQVGQIALALADKHEPAIVDQLAGILQGIGMDAGTTAGKTDPKMVQQNDAMGGQIGSQTPQIQNARASVNNSTRPV